MFITATLTITDGRYGSQAAKYEVTRSVPFGTYDDLANALQEVADAFELDELRRVALLADVTAWRAKQQAEGVKVETS